MSVCVTLSSDSDSAWVVSVVLMGVVWALSSVTSLVRTVPTGRVLVTRT